MAHYEFECTKCGHRFSEEQTFSEHDKHKKKKCPECGSTNTEQLISTVYAKTSKKS